MYPKGAEKALEDSIKVSEITFINVGEMPYGELMKAELVPKIN